MTVVTRFAPSPTGHLHLGHAYSALLAWQFARKRGGRFLLRIEDIDPGRCRPEFEAAILEDLAWLGLAWEAPVRRQSDHLDLYASHLDRLAADGLLYPCFCTRKDIAAAVSEMAGAPHGAPDDAAHEGPDGPLYPGTCRHLSAAERAERLDRGDTHALRLDMAEAVRRTGPLNYREGDDSVPARPERFGDVVLARKEVRTSYHLSCTVDDALQGVTDIVRGEDLRDATDIHRLLQVLFGLASPVYHHHGLIAGPDGKRLAKRDKAATLKALREAGTTPVQILERLGLPGAEAG
ncbi:MAG: tRNA glutamyl-Q(34) synthetase GluQRS [Alphaproteobacteria bacterium]|nr:tRNA glutamyl-Q(34) synthetase GluQRS [Alphaproteobacteria bacterium]